jgi:hypothetical protein
LVVIIHKNCTIGAFFATTNLHPKAKIKVG